MKRRTLLVGDLFAGAGGTSTGALRAIAGLGYDAQLVAVNHWDVAVATHSANHPESRHLCADLDALRPLEAVPEGRLDLLWASPSCTEHSYAKGGKPIDDQNRATAWCVVRWAEALEPKRIIVENVSQFMQWGPLNAKGRPIADKRGAIFRAWIASLESLGYRVEWRVLNSADYGAPQTRSRLFVQARRDRRRLVWPVATHSRVGDELFGERKPWRAAREIIDWSIPSTSIFERDRPLAPNTLRRIEAGIRRYCRGPVAEAFVVVLRRHAEATSLDDPLATVTASGTHLALAEPSLVPFTGLNMSNSSPRSLDDPLATITASGGGGVFLAEPALTPFTMSTQTNGAPRDTAEPVSTVSASRGGVWLAEPSLVAFTGANRSHNVPRDVDEPIAVVSTTGGVFLAEPSISPMTMPQGGGGALRAIDEPVSTVATDGAIALVEPFVTSYYGAKDGAERTRAISEPLPTIPTANRFGIVEPFIVPQHGDGATSIAGPLPTVTTTARGVRLIEPFLTAHFGERDGQAPRTHSVDGPLPTVTHRGAGDLVEPALEPEAGAGTSAGRVIEIDGVRYVIDIRFRMLQPRELARAQGFDDAYQFTGTKTEITAQIGNAVNVDMAEALVRAALHDLPIVADGALDAEGVA